VLVPFGGNGQRPRNTEEHAKGASQEEPAARRPCLAIHVCGEVGKRESKCTIDEDKLNEFIGSGR